MITENLEKDIITSLRTKLDEINYLLELLKERLDKQIHPIADGTEVRFKTTSGISDGIIKMSKICKRNDRSYDYLIEKTNGTLDIFNSVCNSVKPKQ